MEPSLKPTNKLLSAAIVAVILYVVSLFVAVDPQLEQAINVIVPVIVAYFTRNADTPGGVPVKRSYIRGP
jgi:hypothetical protein